MSKSKASIIFLFILFALPIPILLLSCVGIIMSVASMGMPPLTNFSDWLQGILALITMLIAGTYLITYVFSLNTTLKAKKFSFLSFLPLLHIILFIVCLTVWSGLNNNIYYA